MKARSMMARGFTLLEVTIVLAIASLAILTGAQMLDGLRLSSELMQQTNQASQRDAVQQRWLRDCLESVLNVPGNDTTAPRGNPSLMRGQSANFDERFYARPNYLSGITIASLTQPAGIPVAFELSLTVDEANPTSQMILKYRDESLPGANQAIELGRYPRGTVIEFQTLNGDWGDQWPATLGAIGFPEPLPKAIRINEPDDLAAANTNVLEIDPNKRAQRAGKVSLFVPRFPVSVSRMIVL
jgi:prepilin-type N-terminal cleavage/methylation domain-containing protein